MKQKKPRLNLADFRATDREQCGIIVGKMRGAERVAHRIVPVPNAAVNPADDYAITMRDFRRVEKSLRPGEVIVGFFHTHLPQHTANPSENDYEGAKVFPEFLNLIYKPDTGETTWYRALPLGDF